MIHRIKSTIFLLFKIQQTFLGINVRKKNYSKGKSLKIHNMSLSYNVSGKGTIPLVFLHGWGQSKNTWKDIVKILQKDFAVYAIDLPGFGNSTTPTSSLTIEDYVEILNIFYNKLNIRKSIVIGHSFGGKIAASFTVEHPEKIEKLVVYSMDLDPHSRFFKSVMLQTIKIIINPKLSVLIKAYLTARRKSYNNLVILCYIYRNANVSKNLLNKLHRVNKPILFMYGKYDFLYPLHKTKPSVKRVKNAMVIEFQKSSHLAHLEEKEKFTRELVRFIRDNSEKI